MKPPLRTKSVGTKVSEEEFAALEVRARARKLTLSEWVRAELLEPRADDGAADEVLLGKVLALRTIFLNLMFWLTNGKPVTQELIGRADGDKAKRAMERLTAVRAAVTVPEPGVAASIEPEPTAVAEVEKED